MGWQMPWFVAERVVVLRRTMAVCGVAGSGVVAAELLINAALPATDHRWIGQPSPADGPGAFAAAAAGIVVFFWGPILWVVLAAVLLRAARVRPWAATWVAVSLAGALAVIVSRHLSGAFPLARPYVAELGPTSLDAALAAVFAVFAAVATDLRTSRPVRVGAVIAVLVMAGILAGIWYSFASPCIGTCLVH